MLFINVSATSAMMFTSVRQNVLSLSTNMNILTEKPLKYNERDATAVRKHCHQ